MRALSLQRSRAGLVRALGRRQQVARTNQGPLSIILVVAIIITVITSASSQSLLLLLSVSIRARPSGAEQQVSGLEMTSAQCYTCCAPTCERLLRNKWPLGHAFAHEPATGASRLCVCSSSDCALRRRSQSTDRHLFASAPRARPCGQAQLGRP